MEAVDPVQYERKTMIVPPRLLVFEHLYEVRAPQSAIRRERFETDQAFRARMAQVFEARCLTPRPQGKCSCHMYDLAWSRE